MSKDTIQKIAVKQNLKPPSKFKVLYMNDDKTPMDFVVVTLIDFFDHPLERAEALTLKIHEDGKAVVAVLPYELAKQKGTEVTMLAASNGFPLTVKLEEE